MNMFTLTGSLRMYTDMAGHTSLDALICSYEHDPAPAFGSPLCSRARCACVRSRARQLSQTALCAPLRDGWPNQTLEGNLRQHHGRQGGGDREGNFPSPQAEKRAVGREGNLPDHSPLLHPGPQAPVALSVQPRGWNGVTVPSLRMHGVSQPVAMSQESLVGKVRRK